MDEFVIMPNHAQRVSISQIIKSFKEVTVKQMRSRYGVYFSWQRSFHDHIVRGEQDLTRIREYVRNNPLKWEEDVENMNHRKKIKDQQTL